METNVKDFAATVPENTKVILYTKTAVKMNKKDVATKTIQNPHGEVFKTSTVIVTLNANYQDRVNEQRAAEGVETNFVAQDMKYGKMVGNALLENNGQFYVKCIEEERPGNATYTDANGDVINYDDLKPFIPVSKSSGHQGVENEVKVRNFKLESIVGYEIFGA